jgi:hypothetical protein
MPGNINGFSLAYTAIGGIVLWSGIKGETISATFKGLLSGKAPTSGTETIGSGTPATSTGSTGGSGSNTPEPSGTSGSNEQVMKQVAAAFGWTGAQWTALYNVEMAEAGFSLTAQNASGAYGMAQFINGPSEYAQYGGNSTTAVGQATAMCNYIKQRYGTPEAAWAHEQANHWY